VSKLRALFFVLKAVEVQIEMVDAPARMLHISQMKLTNFKSYAGEIVVGPFHKRFTSVVGPNGSGKSNVIDAMLFVFGKRAKQLRLSKVSELIHKSTDYRDLDFARVDVYFEEIIDKPGDDYDVVKGSEFVVSRVAFRDNSSKYYLDDKTKSVGEITTLLKAKGIDLDHNRFLILQGEVEQISLMKPKSPSPHEEGFLEYLEDIIGSNKYVEQIEKSAAELEVLNGERAEKQARVKIAEKDCENLAPAKREAEEFLRKERELILKQSHQCQLSQHRSQGSMETNQALKAELQQQLDAERANIARKVEDAKQFETKYKAEKVEYDVIEETLKNCKAEFAAFERKDVKHQEDMKHMKSKDKKLTDGIVKDKKKIQEQMHALEASRSDLTKAEAESVSLQSELKKEEVVLEGLYDGLKEQSAPLNKKLVSKQAELAPWLEQVNEAQSKLDLSRSELQLIADQEVRLAGLP
jgi:structural maintenance of chromosome 4